MQSFDLDAGHLALDFANTAEWHARAQPDETLNTYVDLVEWAFAAGLLGEDGKTRLKQAAAVHPGEATAALQRAVELRETIYRVFSTIAAGAAAAETDLTVLTDWLQAADAHGVLRQTPAGAFDWQWPATGDLESPMWPVARLSVDLLRSEQVDRVGQCADDRGCGYLFLDITRNRSRRWCSMDSCGNRAKARRYYNRSKAEEAS